MIAGGFKKGDIGYCPLNPLFELAELIGFAIGDGFLNALVDS